MKTESSKRLLLDGHLSTQLQDVLLPELPLIKFISQDDISKTRKADVWSRMVLSSAKEFIIFDLGESMVVLREHYQKNEMEVFRLGNSYSFIHHISELCESERQQSEQLQQQQPQQSEQL